MMKEIKDEFKKLSQEERMEVVNGLMQSVCSVYCNRENCNGCFIRDLSYKQYELSDETYKKLNEVSFKEFSDDEFTCTCGNDCMGEGFFPCNKQGDVMEPLKGSDWDSRYVCLRCGRIYHVI